MNKYNVENNHCNCSVPLENLGSITISQSRNSYHISSKFNKKRKKLPLSTVILPNTYGHLFTNTIRVLVSPPPP